MDFIELTTDQRDFFSANGYLIVPGALDPQRLQDITEAADRLMHDFAYENYYQHHREGLVQNPTLAELADLPPEPKAQGQSLVPLLNNPAAKLRRQDAWTTVARGHGLRSGKWAFMWYPTSKRTKTEGFMLYDMEKDPKQFTNLADDPRHAAIKAKLFKRLKERVKNQK